MVFRRSPELMESLRQAARPTVHPLAAAQGVLWIAIVVRKLSECNDVSLELMRSTWPVRFHWLRPQARACRDDLSAAYELTRWREDEVTTLRLCGLLIHSYALRAADGGVLFTSHLEKDHGLFFLEWAVLGRMVGAVCDDVPRSGVIHAA
jgi:hypothetical protein